MNFTCPHTFCIFKPSSVYSWSLKGKWHWFYLKLIQEFRQRNKETNVQRRNRWHGDTFTFKSSYVRKYDRHIMRNITPHWHDCISAKWFRCEKKKIWGRSGRRSLLSREEVQDYLFCGSADMSWSVQQHVLTCLKNLLYCSVELIISWLRPWLPACCFLFWETTLSWASCGSEGCLWIRQLVDQLQPSQTDPHNKQISTINEPINDLSSLSFV